MRTPRRRRKKERLSTSLQSTHLGRIARSSLCPSLRDTTQKQVGILRAPSGFPPKREGVAWWLVCPVSAMNECSRREKAADFVIFQLEKRSGIWRCPTLIAIRSIASWPCSYCMTQRWPFTPAICIGRWTIYRRFFRMFGCDNCAIWRQRYRFKNSTKLPRSRRSTSAFTSASVTFHPVAMVSAYLSVRTLPMTVRLCSHL